ncbi:MAG TPA: hypothetical protein PK398_03475, partial [Candidatus Gracilibacteria bacterium]|nr:hypothetical protein [Candidatus Gracilibacteria bacterium]
IDRIGYKGEYALAEQKTDKNDGGKRGNRDGPCCFSVEIKKGHRYSLQYHEKKEETQYILKGKARFTYGTNQDSLQEKILNEGDKMDVLPYTIHRLEAIEDVTVLEVSTPDLEDVVKLDDDYGRTGKGNNEELDKKLANT